MKLTILGGFLGSGKTTWLRHQLHHQLLADALVIVNEASDLPIDDHLLAGAVRLLVLAGGCACCDALDRLILLLRAIANERVGAGQPGPRLENLVLETSGLADPARIVEAIRRDPVLVHHVVVRETLVTVDAVHGLGQLRCEPLGRRQAEAADRLVVTKVDEAEPGALAILLATLRQVNPAAGISGAMHGSAADLPDFAAAAPIRLSSLDGDAGPPIFATALSLADADWTAFSVWLSALLHARGGDVMRVKGIVRTPAGRLLLQSVRGVVQSPELLPDADPEDGRGDDAVVVIGRGYTAETLRASLQVFAGR